MENYTETSREDYVGENAAENTLEKTVPEIPVAQPPQDAKPTIIQKTQGQEDELIVTFRKPFDFEGEIFRELDLHGLEDLRGRDLTAIEKAFNKTGVSSFVPESTTTYAKIVATKVTGLPAEFFEDLPVGEIEKIKNAVVGFFYREE